MNGMMELADVPLFLEVARARSFVAASRRTKTPPSTMSRAIARLEAALGVRLFERSSRKVTLTREGLELFQRASAPAAALATALEGVSSRQREPAGLVRITASLWLGGSLIAESLMSFTAKHPGVKIDLQLSNATVDLVEAGFDLAVRAGPVTDASLVARRLWDVPFALAASPEFARRELRGKRALTGQQLASVRAIATTARPWTLRGTDGALIEVPPNDVFRVNDPRVALEAAKRGLGVVRAPLEAVVEAGLVPLECALGQLEPQSVSIVFPSRRHLPARVRLVIDWLSVTGPRRLRAPPRPGSR